MINYSTLDIEQLRNYCLSKPLSEETFPFGPDVIVYKVNKKMFLLASLTDQPLQFNVKCDPELSIQLREEYPCVLPGYHMNKKHWNTILIDGSISTKQLKEWIDHSYDLVLSTSQKRK